MLLAPLSWPYALVMDIRNWMFDHGWLHEKRYDIPTVCIGNLAVGGTGKTPHTEWLVERLLAEHRHVGILSRGYGRSTRGYYEATVDSRADDIGDEPLQMYLRFGTQAIVAVCEDRCHGIECLMERHPELDIIVLDDAFQHRYVRPTLRLLLTDYSRLYTTDYVLPAGRLRERRKGAKRADIIVVTKCPSTLSEAERSNIETAIAPLPHQHVFFTAMDHAPLPISTEQPIALLAGIARPQPLIEHLLAEGYNVARKLIYPDHHNFSPRDLANIDTAAAQTAHIVTTAKDNARLRSLPLAEDTRRKLITQDIHVSVLFHQDTHLIKTINAYVNRH